MKRYLPTVVHTGPNYKAFEVMFGKNKRLGEVRFVHVDSPRSLPRSLSAAPRAVLILECNGSPGIYMHVVRSFPDATVVALTDEKETAQKLAGENIFDVVLESEPGWRLLYALRNAVERSVFRELWFSSSSV